MTRFGLPVLQVRRGSPSLTSGPQASTTPRMHIRSFTSADLPALHAINVAGEPGVGAVSLERLGETIGMGTCLVAETDGQIAGFLLLLPPETAYDSKNYHWFEARYESYVYVDRIAIAASARGKGVGTALYEAGFEQFSSEALLMGCEVNTEPPNPRSLKFHAALGFAEVGRESYAPDYAVAFLARRLGT